MERKLIFGLLVGIILFIIYKNRVCLFEKFSTSLHPIQPNGPYKDKCKQIFYDGIILSALCPNLEGIYTNTRYCTCSTNPKDLLGSQRSHPGALPVVESKHSLDCSCPCVDKASSRELNCGCSSNKFDVDDKGQLICEK